MESRGYVCWERGGRLGVVRGGVAVPAFPLLGHPLTVVTCVSLQSTSENTTQYSDSAQSKGVSHMPVTGTKDISTIDDAPLVAPRLTGNMSTIPHRMSGLALM